MRMTGQDLRQLAQVLCLATEEVLAIRYQAALEARGAALETRIRMNAWATYHMPPQPRRQGPIEDQKHIIQFGSKCVESFFDEDRLKRNAQDDAEVRKYGVQEKYGPMTPAVALSFLVLHEFAHLLVFLDGFPREGHGRRFQQKLSHLHEVNDGVLIAAFLRTHASRRGIDLDSFTVPIAREIQFQAGDRVFWKEPGGKRFGKILRVNKKSVTIQPDGMNWKAYVPPSILAKAESEISDPQA